MSLFASSRPAIKVKLLPRWPSSITATGPIVAEAANGNVNISYDSSSLSTAPTPNNNSRIVIRNGAVYQEYPIVNLATLLGADTGFVNALINGNFAVNQRNLSGTVTLTAGQFGHDCWRAGASGCVYTFTTSGQDTIITISSGTLQQTVTALSVVGGLYTLSHAGTAQARISINGSAPSGPYATTPIQSPSASAGQTVTVEFSTGTISRAQLELGILATTFERRPYGLELMLCNPGVPIDGSVTPAKVSTGTAGPWVFISPNSGTTGAVQVRDATGNPDAIYLQATNNAGSTQYAAIRFRSTGVSEFSGPIGFTDGSTQSSAGIGYSQTWQVVTGSRALATTYTNSTGRPIMVSVLCGGNATTSGLVNGSEVQRSVFVIGGTNTNLCFIVPPSATYSVTSGAGLILWTELR